MSLIYLIQENRFSVQLLAFIVPFALYCFYIPSEKQYPQILLIVVVSYYAIFFSALTYTGSFRDFIGGITGAFLFFSTLSLLMWIIYKQNTKSNQSNFDKMFTIMLEQHNNFFTQKDFNDKVTNIYDDLAFTHINKERRKSDFSVINRYTDNFNVKGLEHVFFEAEHSEVNGYLRFLYNFLKYLSQNREDIENANTYSDILRSFVPPHLLHIIAMNGIRESYYSNEFDIYRNLLEEFNFLEHIDLSVFHQNLTKTQGLENYSFHQNNIIKIEKKLAMNLSENDRAKLLQHLDKQQEARERSKETLRQFDFEKDFHFFIYSKYRSSVFGTNPFYVNYILPALKFLVADGLLPKRLIVQE